MSAKLQIANSTHSKEELAAIMEDYTSAPIITHKQLVGGYSGSSYLVELDDCNGTSQTKRVVKVSNGYCSDDTEAMCRTAYHLTSVGFKECCLPIPKAAAGKDTDMGKDYRFVSLKEGTGVPAFLLNYVDGQQADKVMRERPVLAKAVMRGIGGGLGRMHSASAGIGRDEAMKYGLRWYEKDGGCCDVQDQIDGKVMAKIMGSSSRNHDFIPFYEKELAALKEEMQLSKDGTFALGITHGDPFADNVLVNPNSGALSSFIDIEDVCVGSLLFDLACCSIGCCFKENEGASKEKYLQVLDFALLEALLEGYASGRQLSLLEKDHFVQYMRLTLLCNCCWRFVKFNIDTTSVPDQAKNSYLELKLRIDYLHDSDVISKIQSILQ